MLLAIDDELPFARWDHGLGDVISVDDVLPNPLRDLGAPIRTATAISGSGFEKELFSIRPELSGVVFCDGHCRWQ